MHTRVGDTTVALWRVAELAPHVDRAALLAADEAPEPPYWAHLWSGAVVLAATVQRGARRVLELGCGLGLPRLDGGAAKRGAGQRSSTACPPRSPSCVRAHGRTGSRPSTWWPPTRPRLRSEPASTSCSRRSSSTSGPPSRRSPRALRRVPRPRRARPPRRRGAHRHARLLRRAGRGRPRLGERARAGARGRPAAHRQAGRGGPPAARVRRRALRDLRRQRPASTRRWSRRSCIAKRRSATRRPMSGRAPRRTSSRSPSTCRCRSSSAR